MDYLQRSAWQLLRKESLEYNKRVLVVIKVSYLGVIRYRHFALQAEIDIGVLEAILLFNLREGYFLHMHQYLIPKRYAKMQSNEALDRVGPSGLPSVRESKENRHILWRL